jgi:hypothetical protein
LPVQRINTRRLLIDIQNLHSAKPEMLSCKAFRTAVGLP